MPFESEAQRRFMWARHPEIARRWEGEEKASGREAVVRELVRRKTGSLSVVDGRKVTGSPPAGQVPTGGGVRG